VAADDGDVLLVADSAVVELGLAESLLDSLASAGYQMTHSPPVSGEPTAKTIRRLIPRHERRIAAVIGLGGGSALDAAKLAGLLVANRGLDPTLGIGPTVRVNPRPTLFAVPTTAGTGAEATAVAMVWHQSIKRMFVHPFLVPDAVILDPELLSRLPRSVIAAAGLDAISHAVESLLSTYRTPLTSDAAYAALRRLSRAVPESYTTADLAALHEAQFGAYLAGVALNASVVLGHSIAYTIASRTGLAHGVTCAMALPYCLGHARKECAVEISEIAEIVCREPNGETLARWLSQMNARMDIPASLADVGISARDLPLMAVECIERYPRPNSPIPLSVEDVHSVLEYFLRGDLESAWGSTSAALAGK
jgi:alcohol dehydrogenase class IV